MTPALAPRLIAISDRSVARAEATLERFAALGWFARPGSVVFQLRDLELSARERLAFGKQIRDIARETGQLLVVNDRIDLAVLLDADGIHLGESGLETADARRLLPPGALVSRACHDVSRALRTDGDAVLLAPILEARKGSPALGLDALSAVARARSARGPMGELRPLVYALGGVTAQTAGVCLAAGADGVAAIGGVLGNGDWEGFARAIGIAR